MKHKIYKVFASSLLLAAALLLLQAALLWGQEAPQPLSDADFKAVIASVKPADWEKIKVLTDEQTEAILNNKIIQVRVGIFDDGTYGLWLKGLTSLSEKQAKELAQNEGFLNFDGLTSITETAAKALSRYKGKYIPRSYQNDQQYLNKVGYRAGGILMLNGLTSISEETAKWIGKSQAFELDLNGLTALTDGQAKSLSYFGGQILQLKGITALSDKQAKALAQFTGKVVFSMLDKASRDLFKKYGGVVFGEEQ